MKTKAYVSRIIVAAIFKIYHRVGGASSALLILIERSPPHQALMLGLAGSRHQLAQRRLAAAWKPGLRNVGGA